MSGNESYYKKRCPAMIAAGVADPDSREGALFCAGDRDSDGMQSQCPYPYCIIFENLAGPHELEARERKRVARELHKHLVSVKDIALILDKSTHTVRKYLKK